MRQDVRNWLSPPDPWKNHNVVHESRHSGTGTWLIQGDTYAEWKSSGPSSLLWINGKRQYFVPVFFPETDYFCLPAGAGKSVIWCDNLSIVRIHKLMLLASSAIIEDIRTLQKSGMASLHCAQVPDDVGVVRRKAKRICIWGARPSQPMRIAARWP